MGPKRQGEKRQGEKQGEKQGKNQKIFDPNQRRRKPPEYEEERQEDEPPIKKGVDVPVSSAAAVLSENVGSEVKSQRQTKATLDSSVYSSVGLLPVSSVKTPKQLEEDAYNGMLQAKINPSVIHGDPNLLIAKYSATILPADDEVAQEVEAINSATLRNQLAIQSTYGHESWEYNLLKLPPRIIKKSGKQEVVETAYDQTVRMQTLEEIGILDESTGTITSVKNSPNLLKIQDKPIKSTIAFQQEDNNPNGVLSVALTKALDYLVSNTKERFVLIAKVSPEVSMRVELPKCRQTIEEIKNASRGAKSKEDKDLTFKVFSNSLLKAFYEKVINGGINSEEKMKTIIGVYGSFLNKGLSDTAQGGELIKVWLLKFMEKFKNGHELAVRKKPGFKYWDTTCGIPYLKLLSSDKIASALYIRLINLFKGGMISIQPYKSGGAESSTFYLPKKYVGLIIAMTTEGSIPSQIFLNFYEKCIGGFINHLNISGGDEQFKNLILKINEIIQCLYGLIQDSDYMNIYDIIRVLEDNKAKIIDYIINGNLSRLPQTMKQNIKCIDLLFKANGGLYTNFLAENIHPEDMFNYRIKYLKDILDCFGIFIQQLSDYVIGNEAVLEGLFDGMQDEYFAPQAFSMIAETVGYYDNCMFLRSLSPKQCLQKYFEVCREEVVCAFADVNYGHDQDIDHPVLQKLGEKFMEILCKEDANPRNPPALPEFMRYINRTYQGDKKYNVNEHEISKIILDENRFVSICQLGLKDQPALIAFKKTDDSKEDFINEHTYVTQFENKFGSGAVCGRIWVAADFVQGRPLEIRSKVDFRNGLFTEFDSALYFIANPREQEIRTPSTFADLAAPPGCAFASVGNMAISCITFVFKGSQYIYEISTFDLGGNKTKNTNDFEIGPCLAQNISDRFTQIFTAVELKRYHPETEELNELFLLLEKFSINLTAIKNTDANQIDRFFSQIEDAIRNHPKLRNNTSEFFTSLFALIDPIIVLTNQLRALEGQQRKKTEQGKLITQIKNIRGESFAALKILLKERYIKIYETLAGIKEGVSIPPEITDEIIDITTFLQIVNGLVFGNSSTTSVFVGNMKPTSGRLKETGTSMSPKASASQSDYNFRGPAATFISLQPNMGRGEDAAAASQTPPQRTEMKRSDSVSSYASSNYSYSQKEHPFWYYLLNDDDISKWFSDKGINVSAVMNYDIDDISEKEENDLCTDMATVYCYNLSKAKDSENTKAITNCIDKRKRAYLQKASQKKHQSSDSWKDINTIKTELAKAAATVMDTDAGGAKRTRKHKLNKNRRKTKHINKFNRKRKTKRLIKNKRRLTKKR